MTAPRPLSLALLLLCAAPAAFAHRAVTESRGATLVATGELSPPPLPPDQDEDPLAPPPLVREQDDAPAGPNRSSESAPSASPSGSAPARRTRERLTSGDEEANPRRVSAPERATGGAVLITTELLAGMVSGGFLGASMAGPDSSQQREGIYFGSLGAGLLLGTAAGVYQHFVDVHMSEAWLSSVGGVAGALAGYGLASALRLDPGSPTAWSVALGAQLGIIVPLALTAGGGPLSAGDFWMCSFGAVHATLMGLMWAGVVSGRLDSAPALIAIAPALGMGIGGALAAAFDVSAGKVALVALPPIGISWTVFLAGYTLTRQDVRLASVAGILSLAISITAFALLAPSDEPTPARRESRASWMQDWMPAPTVVVSPTGRTAPGLGVARVF